MIVRAFDITAKDEAIQAISLKAGTWTFHAYVNAETYSIGLKDTLGVWHNYDLSDQTGAGWYDVEETITTAFDTVQISLLNNAGTAQVMYPMFEKGARRSVKRPHEKDIEEAAIIKSASWEIHTSSPVIYKDAPNLLTDGAHTPVTVTGRHWVGSVMTEEGFITVTANDDTEALNASPSPVVIAPLDSADKHTYTIRLYNDAAKTELLDYEDIPVVFKGARGVDALRLHIENPVDVIPADSEGVVLTFTGTGTIIRMYEGAVELDYDGVGTANGKYKVTAVSTGITVGAMTDGGNFCVVADATAMTTEKATIVYTVTGKTLDGFDFTETGEQNFTKTSDGADGTGILSVIDYYGLSASASVLPATWQTTVPTKPANEFLWNYERIIYTDTTYDETEARVIQTKDAKSISTIVNAYAYSASDTVSPTNGWVASLSELGAKPEGYFLWVRDDITYTDGTSESTIGYVVRDGSSAPLLYLSSSAQVMKCTPYPNYNPEYGQTINIEAKLQNVNGTATFVATPYNDAGTALTPITLGGTGNVRTLIYSQWSASYKRVEIVATLGSLSDIVTIYRLTDGADGAAGSDGADGENPIIGFLTNENVTLQASSAGVVSSFSTATGEFWVYDGLTRVTAGITFSKVSETGCTAAITTAGVYSVSAMSANNAQVVLRAVYNGVTMDKVFTLSKSNAGDPGTDGKGISSTVITYQASTSGTVVPTGTWTPSIPEVSPGQYLWTRTIITYTDSTTSTSYSVSEMGVGVSSVRTEYYLSTSGTTQNGGTWQTTVPTWTSGTYIWERLVTVKTDATESIGTPYLSQTWENINQLKADMVEEQAKTGGFEVAVDGGLIYAALMKLFDGGASNDETAGINGIIGTTGDNPAFYAGGTFAQAIGGTAKVIIRHDGKASFGGGTSMFNPDGSGQLAGGNISWDISGNLEVVGKITGTTGEIGPFTISSSSLVATSGTESMLLSANLIRFLGAYSSLYMGADTFPASGGGTLYGTQRINVSRSGGFAEGNLGLHIDITGAQAYDDDNSQYTGNHALYIPHGDITGVRFRTRRVSGTKYLSAMDTNVLVIAASTTIWLPNNPEDGQMYWIFPRNYSGVTARSYQPMYSPADGGVTTVTLAGNRWYLFIYDKVNTDWLFTWMSA